MKRRSLVPILCMILLLLNATNSNARETPPTKEAEDPSNPMCMVYMPQAGPPPNFAMPVGPLSPGAIQNCGNGALQAYFEDVDDGTGARTKLGFDDPVDGANRRACVCSVLTYLENLLTIDPGINASNPITIKFDKWVSPSIFIPGSLKAFVYPNYPTSLPGFHHSYMGNAIINGGINVGANHAGSIQINWSHSFAYCNGSPVGDCQLDFFDLILHEVSHLLGLSSSLQKDMIGGNILQPMGPSTYTKYDESFLYFNTGTMPLTKIVNNSTLLLNVAAPVLAASFHNVWLNGDDLTTTRTNQPIEDAVDLIAGRNISYDHLVEDFYMRGYESPGFAVPYIMDWTAHPGIHRGEYSLQEMRMLTVLGFTPNSSDPRWAKASNTPPRTLGQIVSNVPILRTPLHLGPGTPVGNSDLIITTTNCHPVTIDLNAGTGGTITGWDPLTNTAISHTLGVDDPDPGTTLYVYDNKLWPINGCSNNLGQSITPPLTLSGSVITFTPRPDFLGRARFAFHLGDGTERGSFIVVTIDVEKDVCFIPHDACDLVINGGFEEGTAINSYNFSSGTYNMPWMADNTTFMSNYLGGNNCVGGQIFSDGTELFHWGHPQMTICEAFTPMYCFGPVHSYFTGFWFNLPNRGTIGQPLFPYPSTITTPSYMQPGKRYVLNMKARTPTAPPVLTQDGDHNMTLFADMMPGALYQLVFHYNFPQYGMQVYTPSVDPLVISFTSQLNGSAINLPSVPVADRINTNINFTGLAGVNNWQQFVHQFTYSGNLGNRFMRIGYDPGNPSPNTVVMAMDNVQLRRIIIPAFTITASGCGGTATISATVPGGNIISWQWYDGAGNAIFGANTPVLSVTQFGDYTLEAIDINGCKGSATYSFTDPCPKYTADVLAAHPGNAIYDLDPSMGPISSLPGVPYDGYRICGTIHIASSVVFDRNYVLMGAGSEIIIDNSAQLTITESHLATCPEGTDMWKGITLGTDRGQVRVIGGSLIEDAENAIKADNQVSWVAHPGWLIETDDAIFNRNTHGIAITNDHTLSFPYRITNSVFTSRNLNTYNDFTKWDKPVLLKTAKAILPQIYQPNYLLDDASKYAKVDCKNALMAYAGIYLDLAGNATSITPPAYSYTGVEVGDRGSLSHRNLFDYMIAGIEAHNSNLYVYNSTFMNMRTSIIPGGSSGGGVGVYSESTGGNISELKVTRDLNYLPRNEFYENRRGVESFNNHDALIDYNYIGSTNTVVNPLVGTGFDAIFIRSNYYNDIKADWNTIDNYIRGIVVQNDNDITVNGLGYLAATNNTITIALTPVGKRKQNQNIGILFDNIVGTFMPQLGYFSTTPWVDISGNRMYNVYNGVSENNFLSQWSRINNNIINMQEADIQLPQYGILNTVNSNIRVVGNTLSSTGTSNDNARGVGSSSCNGAIVNCNTETSIGRGYEFYGTDIFANWLGNYMSNNVKGFYLNNSMILDQTSTVSVPVEGCNNHWTGTWPLGTTWHTWTDNSNPNNSQLNILFGSSSDLVPSQNSSTPPATAYSISPFIGIASASSLYAFCGPYWHPAFRVINSDVPATSDSKNLTMVEKIAMDKIVHGYSDEDRKRWIAQMQLYTAILADSSLRKNSPVLNSFFETASQSRYAWIAQIQNHLSNGKDQDAAILMKYPPVRKESSGSNSSVVLRDYIGTAGDNIVENYLAYFRLYLNWHSNRFTESDSIELSNLALMCPHRDGNGIYGARSLLRRISNEFVPYGNDECDGLSNSTTTGEPDVFAEKQKYSLFPNPTSGVLQLQQLLIDKAPVHLSVYNALGELVYSGDKSFTSGRSTLNPGDIAPGVYHLVLQDSQAKVYTLRFVKQ